MSTKSKIKNNFIVFARRQEYNKLVTMRGNYTDMTIKFIYPNGSHKLMRCNPQFFADHKSKKLRVDEILRRINTIKHDEGAKYFSLIIN